MGARGRRHRTSAYTVIREHRIIRECPRKQARAPTHMIAAQSTHTHTRTIARRGCMRAHCWGCSGGCPVPLPLWRLGTASSATWVPSPCGWCDNTNFMGQTLQILRGVGSVLMRGRARARGAFNRSATSRFVDYAAFIAHHGPPPIARDTRLHTASCLDPQSDETSVRTTTHTPRSPTSRSLTHPHICRIRWSLRVGRSSLRQRFNRSVSLVVHCV